jgi:hypothetical protein
MTTTTNDKMPETARLLAEAHAASRLARDAAGQPGTAAVGVHALWAHVRRKAGTPVSFVVERAIRTDPDVARRYRVMLASVSLAYAPFAMAASDGSIRERRVDPFLLRIVEEDGEASLLVIEFGERLAPSILEIAVGDERLRLDLPQAINGHVVLSSDPANTEAAQLFRLLRDPSAEIYFL